MTYVRPYGYLTNFSKKLTTGMNSSKRKMWPIHMEFRTLLILHSNKVSKSCYILIHMYWFVINYSGILRPSQHLLHHTIGHSLPESSSCDATCSNTSLPKQGAKRVPCRLRTCILPYVTKNRLCHAALRTRMIRSCWEQPWRTTLPVTRHQ